MERKHKTAKDFLCSNGNKNFKNIDKSLTEKMAALSAISNFPDNVVIYNEIFEPEKFEKNNFDLYESYKSVKSLNLDNISHYCYAFVLNGIKIKKNRYYATFVQSNNVFFAYIYDILIEYSFFENSYIIFDKFKGEFFEKLFSYQ